MAIMHPNNLSEYMPTDSERQVYYALKTQLPSDYHVFYSVKWTNFNNDKLLKSEADFIVVSPKYGYLCLEVKGGSDLIENLYEDESVWKIVDLEHGARELSRSPYDQAEFNMYYFYNTFSNKYNTEYSGIYGAGVVLPFYSLSDSARLDNRHRSCTIDFDDLNNIYDRIKLMFKLWGGTSFGRKYYPLSQHEALMEVIRERIAISAAAGALIKYKEHQLSQINRVQENYIYFLNCINQFYIRGGAGTGKTWIAMKMAVIESDQNKKVLFCCCSSNLVKMVKNKIGNKVEVLNISELKERDSESNNLRYDAIFVDEAQDLSNEDANYIRQCLIDDKSSRLGVFYDDVQVFRENSFGDGFKIDNPPFLLHENIRNTLNIYRWASEKTELGMDVILNPVEGPSPVTEYMREPGQLTITLEKLLNRYLRDEYVSNKAITILVDDLDYFFSQYSSGIAKWKFIHDELENENEIKVYSVEEYKGLETDMAIYIHDNSTSLNINYIAYTRAKYYLIELVRMY